MSVSSPTSTSSGSVELDRIIGDPRSVVRVRVLHAARHLIAERGLAVSMEDVADAAGVGRRTLFRHFESREMLVADALSSALDRYTEQIHEVARVDQPLDDWISALVARVHEIHRSAGRGLWQLAASHDTDLSPELAAVNRRRRKGRRVTTAMLADAAWKRAGGSGRCPTLVVDACALTVSSFATHSMIDYDRDPRSVTRCSAALLSALLRSEVAVQTGS
jgi:AcrR family transcriptional regulator